MSMYSDEIKNTHDLEMNAMAPTRCRKCKYSGGDLGRFPCQTEKQTNPMNTQSTGESEGWEETWRSGRMLQACHCDSCHEQIKSFISQTITTVRREEREKVVRILEAMIKIEASIPIPQIRGDSYRMGHNKALSDAITDIKGEGKV